ncbi:molybdenum cofactor guanylyltransferase MobA [Cognatishimia maritima]|uniref:Molybdenum cofactor guanylyltransferase n=1 Tax=Cognatishimia maritima TaxID=870908 RepID=A0A1M5RRS6_9RHOB|nr:molybdenum cofactor guanylyltransferase MobA [Cognatishimia maritima]SHH28859.1 molybdenum cofactor guanylyltransferase [Cognatishimia maritima]
MSAPLGVILAGGQSRRMGGGDKGMLTLGDKPILQHVIDRLAPQVSAMALNANGDGARFQSFGLLVLPDSIAGFPGPLAGVLAGLDWAHSQGAEAIVTAAADTPFFPHNLVARLIAAADKDIPLALAATQETDGKRWRQPTFGLWPVALRHDLRTALEDGLRKVVLWTDRHHAGEAVFDLTDGDPFFNVNTPEDLTVARQLAEGAT